MLIVYIIALLLNRLILSLFITINQRLILRQLLGVCFMYVTTNKQTNMRPTVWDGMETSILS